MIHIDALEALHGHGKINHIIKYNMKSKIAALAMMAAVSLPAAVPVFAASSAYNFTMSNLVVNGCGNGNFHYLESGAASISGSATAPGSQITIYYNLQREVFGSNPSYGTVGKTPNSSFSGNYNTLDVTSSKYCLYIWRSSTVDGTAVGSGTLSN